MIHNNEEARNFSRVYFTYLLGNVTVLSRFLSFIGRHSMTMFLTHTFIRWPYCEGVVYGTGNFLVNWVVLLALSVAVAVTIDWLFDKVRLKSLISRLTRMVDSMCLATESDAV